MSISALSPLNSLPLSSLVPGGMPAGMPAGIPAGIPGAPLPTGVTVTPENPPPSGQGPAPTPAAGANPAQQQLMQQMLQMFAGGSASVLKFLCWCCYLRFFNSIVCKFDCTYFTFCFADSDSRSAFPATAGAAECHGLHQQGSQPAGPHRYRGRHQRRHRKTARLPAFLIPSAESVRRETRSKHSPSSHKIWQVLHRQNSNYSNLVFFFLSFFLLLLRSVDLWIKSNEVSNLFPWTKKKKTKPESLWNDVTLIPHH